MKFWEAVEVARRTGKKIKRTGSTDVASWVNNKLMWNCTDTVMVYEHNIASDWQVIEPPPKEYDFAEAYRMMKDGKWMKPVDSACKRTYQDKAWWVKVIGELRLDDNLPLSYIESKWIEVLP